MTVNRSLQEPTPWAQTSPPERIAEQIAEIQEKLSAANVTPDMLIEAPKPVVPKDRAEADTDSHRTDKAETICRA